MAAEHKDTGKPPVADVPRSLILAVAKVLQKSQESGKYARYNWREGAEYTRFAASLVRHVFAWLDGEDLDPESGLSHLWHAATNCAFLIEWLHKKIGTDDRYTKKENHDAYRDITACGGAVAADILRLRFPGAGPKP